MSTRPPRLPERLLGWVTPAAEREFLLGDLEERYRDVLAARGKTAARVWYWSQTLRMLVRIPGLHGAGLALDGLGNDLRFAMHVLRRDAAATSFAVAIATLGIGAGATVFSICQALLIRPLPFDEPDRLVWIANGTSENLSAQTVQVTALEQLLAEGSSFSDIAGFSPFYVPGGVRLGAAGEPTRVTQVPVTRNFFPLLGVRPRLGRYFDEEESRWGAPMTVVLSHDFWHTRFADDPSVLGRTITLDGNAATIIGVLPGSFDFAATFTPGRAADYFVPFPLSDETDRRGNTLALVGRLEDGVDMEAAQTEATAIGKHVIPRHAGDRPRNKLAPRLSTLTDRVSGRFTLPLLVLAAAVGFLLLLVCANLSNLLLLRGSGRRREMAVRTALGASRLRLVRLLLVESLLLGASGATLGLLLSVAATALLAGIRGTAIPLLSQVRVDPTVAGLTALATVLTSVAVGVLPAFQATGGGASSSLSDGSRGSTGGAGAWVRRGIVVAEVALGCVLLTGAGLLTRSLLRVLGTDPGFATANLVVMRVDPAAGQTSPEVRQAYLDDIVREVKAVPGVDALGLTDALPLGDNFGWRRWDVRPSEAPDESGETETLLPLIRIVSPGYLDAMAIPVEAGRTFHDGDGADAERVVIVNDLLAAALFPDQEAVGRFVRVSGRDRRIVGVVGGVRYFALDRPAEPEMYLPVAQEVLNYQSLDLVVRSRVPPASMVTDVRAALRRADPTLPVAAAQTMLDLVDRALFPRRFIVLLVTGFAVFGLVLFSLGIYVVIAYAVRQRTREIGIRMALGATSRRVRAGVLGDTGVLALAGLGVGLPLAWATTRALGALLYGVDTSDPVTYAVVLAALAGVSALAGFLPARRATLIDPAVALRSD